MKQIVALFLSVFLCHSVFAAGEGMGVGLIASHPTGLTLKRWRSDTTAIDAAVEWETSDDDRLYFHASYLMHDFSLFKPENTSARLPLYYGVGAYVDIKENRPGKENRDDVFGLRVPVGISMLFNSAPFEIFVELVPTLDLSPDMDLNFEAAFGGRFYF